MGAQEHHISILWSFHHCQHHRFITNPSMMQSPTLQSRNLYTECGPRNNHRDEAHLHPFTALQYIHFSINNFNRNTQHVHHLWSSVTFRTSTLPSPYPKVPKVSRRCRWRGTVGQQILRVQKGHQGPWCQPLTPCCITVKSKGGRNIWGSGRKREKGSRTWLWSDEKTCKSAIIHT